MVLLGRFSDVHARRLQSLLDEPDWRSLLAQGAVDAAAATLRTPPPVESVFSLPVDQLVAINGGRVREMIATGVQDEERLLAVLGTWPQQWPDNLPVRLSFVGLNLTFDCDMRPRCVYCNQDPVAQRLGLADWQALMDGMRPTCGSGVYVSMTGGEPLLLGEGLWGHGGLIRTAGDAAAACNMNTNALALTPRAALGLVSSGLSRVHISLDTHREEVADAIHQRAGRWWQVMRGLSNLQLAKALLNADHPVIHLNCVLTRLNAPDFPEFLRFLVDMKPLPEEGLSSDLDLHLIPVGGADNGRWRLSADQYIRFFTQTWAEADAVWQEYQAERGIPAANRRSLHESQPFLSPYHRVAHRGSLRDWAVHAAAGRPGALALPKRCYVAPTQGFILPDGSQYWCGGHAVSRPAPVGSVLTSTVQDNIRRALPQLTHLPGPHCVTCPGATLAINQTVENRLREVIAGWLAPRPPADESSHAQGTQGPVE